MAGSLMQWLAPNALIFFLATAFALYSGYAAWRISRRPDTNSDKTDFQAVALRCRNGRGIAAQRSRSLTRFQAAVSSAVSTPAGCPSLQAQLMLAEYDEDASTDHDRCAEDRRPGRHICKQEIGCDRAEDDRDVFEGGDRRDVGVPIAFVSRICPSPPKKPAIARRPSARQERSGQPKNQSAPTRATRSPRKTGLWSQSSLRAPTGAPAAWLPPPSVAEIRTATARPPPPTPAPRRQTG